MNRARVSSTGQAVSLAMGLLFGLGLTTQANAQWLPDRQYQEGPGIRAGELEIHPGIAIRGGYDTNVFRADNKVRQGQRRKEEGAAVIAVTPHIFLTNETAQRAREGEDRPAAGPRFLGFRLGAAASYLHYFHDNAPRNVAVDTDFFLGIAQGRPVGVDLAASYTRSVAPFTEKAGPRKAYVFDRVQPSLRLKFNSKSQVLTGYVGYAPNYTHYEHRVFNYLNNISHGVELGMAWRFLPSTALVYDARLGLQDYRRSTASAQRTLLYSDNQTFRTRLGINGALTNSLTLRVLAGYAVGFYENPNLDEFEDGVGEAVLSYTFGPHGLEIGYQRDVQPSPLGAWYQTDRGFAKLTFLMAGRFLLGFEAGVAYARYGSLLRATQGGGVEGIGVNGDRSRTDIRVDGAIRAEYRATNWLSFMADAVTQVVITDFEYGSSVNADTQFIPDPAGFKTFQFFGGVRAHY